MPLIDTLILVLIGVNIVVALALLVIFLKNYKAISSRLTLGLLLFAAAVLVENLANLYFYNSILLQQIYGLTTFILVGNLLEMLALIVLAWVTWK